MRTFTAALEEILKDSRLWWEGRGGRLADLSGANLRDANLRDANLRCADLSGADLYHADLSGANLRDANLRCANLRGADLSGADLYHADLSGANLRDANLRCANLSGTNLSGADLGGADLSGADLSYVDLRGTNLRDAKNSSLTIARTRILPEGDIIGWKKCSNSVLVKLLIPAAARRSHAWGRKCRAEYADVLEVIGAEEAVSLWNGTFKYQVGQRVTPSGFNPDWTVECSSGIHFYITQEEAVAHE